jgi:hypothetical protein
MRRRIHVMKASVDIKCWDKERRGHMFMCHMRRRIHVPYEEEDTCHEGICRYQVLGYREKGYSASTKLN